MKINVICHRTTMLETTMRIMVLAVITFMPYCIFATTGLSDIKVNIFRFMVNGSGMIKPMKRTISATRRRNT